MWVPETGYGTKNRVCLTVPATVNTRLVESLDIVYTVHDMSLACRLAVWYQHGRS